MGASEDYQAGIMQALERFQFIEEALKECIFSAVKIAENKLAPFFPVNYKAKDISKLPLGSLINNFVKINSDSKLHKELRDITQERNYIAHQSFLFTLGELEDEDLMKNELKKILDISEKAKQLHNKVLDVRFELKRAERKALG
ncbi:MAG: hypothetical protein OEY67_00940 [Gammaproteobacteria bacterium]|nr:hypothetical protein [Gammaproteobacteria bacterium]